jgi:hypothetical protein
MILGVGGLHVLDEEDDCLTLILPFPDSSLACSWQSHATGSFGHDIPRFRRLPRTYNLDSVDS